MAINSYENERALRKALARRGHRELIGGMWDEMGDLQLAFLRAHGLSPSHTLLDVGCGAGRLAVRAVPYLEPGRYFGLDVSPSLLDAARRELAAVGLLDRLTPDALTATADFLPHAATPPIDIAIAQSVFTHLPLAAVTTCLRALAPRMAPGGIFYATFFVAPAGAGPTAHAPGGIVSYPDADPFHFDIEAILAAARAAGWAAAWIGDWAHPRDQQMAVFTPGA